MHSLHSTMQGSIKTAPGAAMFQCNMLLNVPFQADLHAVQQRCQLIIDESLLHANNKRRAHDCQVGDPALIPERGPAKMDERTSGPFEIRRVHANGAVSLQVKPNVAQRINFDTSSLVNLQCKQCSPKEAG